MEITLTIPDDLAAKIQKGGSTPLARRLLELATIKAYETDLLTTRQAQEMLGFESREELFAFFCRSSYHSRTILCVLDN